MPNRWDMPPVYLQSGDPETESVATLHAPGLLGSRFTVIQPSRGGATATDPQRSKRYQLVKTDSTMTVAPFPGAVAWWGDQSQYIVTTTSPSVAQGRNRVAGRFTRAWNAPGDYMCVQFGGPGLVKLIDGVTQANVVVGAYIIPSSTNAKADVVAASTAPTQTPLGTVSSALVFNPADLTVLVDLQIPETT